MRELVYLICNAFNIEVSAHISFGLLTIHNSIELGNGGKGAYPSA
jgi:hypothetical protein